VSGGYNGMKITWTSSYKLSLIYFACLQHLVLFLSVGCVMHNQQWWYNNSFINLVTKIKQNRSEWWVHLYANHLKVCIHTCLYVVCMFTNFGLICKLILFYAHSNWRYNNSFSRIFSKIKQNRCEWCVNLYETPFKSVLGYSFI